MTTAMEQKVVIKEAFDSIPKEVRDRHIKAAYDENEGIRKAAEKVVALYDKDTGDSVVEWTYALRDAVKELEKALKP